MAVASTPTLLTVALIGNPNTGKSTLFSALAGIHQRVGNYPGVTVEKKTGRMEYAGRQYELIDLPGLYSLAPRSRDEMVAVDVLMGRSAGSNPVDAVVCIVDASNLPRNLYLVSQVLELGLPTILAVNMIDIAEGQGVEIDLEQLAQRLPVPVVAVQANRRKGIAQLKSALDRCQAEGGRLYASPLPEVVRQEVEPLKMRLAARPSLATVSADGLGFLAQRLLLDEGGYAERGVAEGDVELLTALEEARTRVRTAGCRIPGVETDSRYDWVTKLLDGVISQGERPAVTVTDRIDRVLTHRLWGSLVLLLVMVAVFQSVFSLAAPFTDWIDTGVSALGDWVAGFFPEGAVRDLLTRGVFGGVGGVLAFVPQIAILFVFIAVLEDCGYMARGAYLMDKLMVRVGLSGKSFLPMLSSFACAIPGIMAARVIENERDRLTTIVAAPLLTCSARLPVYGLMIAAFIPARSVLGGLMTLQGLTLIGLYVLGVVAAVLVALVLKRTLLRGETPLFLMELPSYKWPSLRTVAFRVAERCLVFLRCAGTLILAVSVLTWAASYYPRSNESIVRLESQREALVSQREAATDPTKRAALDAQVRGAEATLAAEHQRYSILGKLGRVLAPVVRPLGWDWRIGCAVLASFPAREVVVATLGVIFDNGQSVEGGDDDDTRLQSVLKTATWEGTNRPLFNVPVALSIMVFFALCAQCAATLAVIRRETNSWRWPVFTFGYMTGIAYVAAFAVYQFGTWLGG